jgi:hypothetical protein
MNVPEPRQEMTPEEIAASAARVLALAQKQAKPPEFKVDGMEEAEERYRKVTGKA